MSGIWALLYPFTAFLFIRASIRTFGRWAARPRPMTLIAAVALMSFTMHAGWMLYVWSATLPHWWITPLVTLAFAWIIYKNLRSIWKFPNVGPPLKLPQMQGREVVPKSLPCGRV